MSVGELTTVTELMITNKNLKLQFGLNAPKVGKWSY